MEVLRRGVLYRGERLRLGSISQARQGRNAGRHLSRIIMEVAYGHQVGTLECSVPVELCEPSCCSFGTLWSEGVKRVFGLPSTASFRDLRGREALVISDPATYCWGGRNMLGLASLSEDYVFVQEELAGYPRHKDETIAYCYL